MFHFKSSFAVSMMACFLCSILSDSLITALFILFLSLAISCMPSTKLISQLSTRR